MEDTTRGRCGLGNVLLSLRPTFHLSTLTTPLSPLQHIRSSGGLHRIRIPPSQLRSCLRFRWAICAGHMRMDSTYALCPHLGPFPLFLSCRAIILSHSFFPSFNLHVPVLPLSKGGGRSIVPQRYCHSCRTLHEPSLEPCQVAPEGTYNTAPSSQPEGQHVLRGVIPRGLSWIL